MTAALAQSPDLSGSIQPTVIDIQQSVPALAEIDGITVPITVDVALQVSLSDPVNTSVETAPTPVVKVETPTPRPSLDDEIASAEPLDYEEVARYTENHIGEAYSFRAKVATTYDGITKADVSIQGTKLNYGSAVIRQSGNVVRLLEGDYIDVVARVHGLEEWGDVCPGFTVLSIEIVKD